MSKKNKNKPKKISAKKEKYAKFKKDKPSGMDLSMPDLSEDEMKQKKEDELKIDRFIRFNRNPPPKEIVPRKALSKR
jgi:hypothetical protein